MNGNNKFYKITSSDDRYKTYSFALLKDDINVLPTDVQIGSSATYTNPTTGEFKVYMLTSADKTIDNLIWKQI